MDISGFDLNLLRVFDAIYRHRSVSRAALALGLSQPATSQALTRLRLMLRHPLFERTHGGVRPTPRADQLAAAVQHALGSLETAVRAAMDFDPGTSTSTFRLHLSDIGEARFLPALMNRLQQVAPHVRLECRPWPMAEIAPALDRGTLDAAIGFLPEVTDTAHVQLLQDRYVVLLRARHPALQQAGQPATALLHGLDFLAVTSHSVPLQLLHGHGLGQRIRLSVAHFLAVPNIIRQTDLAVLMPRQIAQAMAQQYGCALLDLEHLPDAHFAVDLHWSQRFAEEPAKRWLLDMVQDLFRHAQRAPVVG